jgi:hypothetical protein
MPGHNLSFLAHGLPQPGGITHPPCVKAAPLSVHQIRPSRTPSRLSSAACATASEGSSSGPLNNGVQAFVDAPQRADAIARR